MARVGASSVESESRTEAPSLSLILPAFNESGRLAESLERVRAYVCERPRSTEVIVVDDGSADGTADVAEAIAERQPCLRVVRLARNGGKGAAVRAGVRAARARELIAFLDADLTIPVELLDELVAQIEAGADIAIASRYVPGSLVRRPLLRRAMGRAFRVFVRALVPTGLQDTQCGGKCYRADLARDLFARQRIDGFAFDAEVLFLARRTGRSIAEVPFTLVQTRDTSIRLLKDTFSMLRDLARIRWRAMRGGYDRA